MARLISGIAEKHKLSPRPIIVVNKSGGAGAEGFLHVKGKKGDPHTLVITLSNIFTTPLHTHSYEERVVTVSGTFIHGPEGKPEVRLPAGSYLLEPANYRHTTACDKASECVFFIEGKGKFDVKLVEKK